LRLAAFREDQPQGRIMLEEKLYELQAEYERGQEQLALLDQKRADLRDTLLRISGAIQVLKELSAENGRAAPTQGGGPE
jgi:prefoldin subunit 5